MVERTVRGATSADVVEERSRIWSWAKNAQRVWYDCDFGNRKFDFINPHFTFKRYNALSKAAVIGIPLLRLKLTHYIGTTFLQLDCQALRKAKLPVVVAVALVIIRLASVTTF